MLRSQVETMVRADTGHEFDTQFTQQQLYDWLLAEYSVFRREVAAIAPTFYAKLSATQVLTLADPDFDLPLDYESLIRFERLTGVSYVPVDVADELAPEMELLAFREEAGVFRLAPTADAAGTYRMCYVPTPVVAADYTIVVPPGCELVIVERLNARVRRKFNEDPTPHLQAAKLLWHGEPGGQPGQKTYVRRRYGKHALPGFRGVTF
jgi:hypothetical protein